jgi:hypothetical protein
MAYPTVYDVTYSYTGFQAAQGDDSFPGTQLDADLAGLQASLESLTAFMDDVIRSDGALQNSIVTYDSLSPDLQTAGLAPAAAWATATQYAANANVIKDFGLYRATAAHLSNVFATDLAAARWTLVTTLPTAAYVAGAAVNITGLVISVSGVTTAQFAANVIDTDATFAANSDTRLPTQKAVATKFATLGTASTRNTGVAAGNVPVLDGSGLLETSVLPALAISSVSVVASQVAMLALTVQQGDVAVRSDLNKSYILSTNSPSTLADWKELLTPTDAVLSVAALTGAVSAAALKTALAIAVADVTDMTANGRSLVAAAANYAAMRTLLNVGQNYGQCVLAKSGSNLVLTPKNGNLLTINGLACTVPDAGVSLAPGVLVAGTLYYIYAVATAGAVSSLEASTTAYAVSTTAGNKGVVIKSGDDTRTLVGMARPITGPAWSDLINQRFVRSWFNDPGVSVTASLTADRTVTSVALTYAEIHSEMRVEALSWAGETWDLALGGSVSNTNTGQSVFTAVGFDGVTAESPASTQVMANGNAYQSVGFRVAKAGLSEGYHYGTGLGAVTANTGQWRGVNTPTGISGRVGR